MNVDKSMSKILIVDDNIANVLLLERMLNISGYKNIKTLTDSREILRLYSTYKPNLILLDFRMPFVDGLQIIDELNLIKYDNKLSIIMISAENDKEYYDKALAKGAADFITKPFNYDDIISKITSTLQCL
ncbi:response regulator [Clostridium sp. YIM B02569]|uniref:response regulator n=1 Tax=Clostridium sp. YIM B02569 TaxID=2911967 RepID=UPI001EEBEABC|nr:response regulator [Clostridium sp. YIM B02569]